MANDSEKQEAVKAPEKLRYINRSKVTQTIYINGAGVRIPVGDKVMLPPEVGEKHFNILKPDDEFNATLVKAAAKS